MCGRFTETKSLEDLSLRFGFAEPDIRIAEGIRPRYNVAPTQLCPIVVLDEHGTRQLVMLQWGLIPPWAKEAAIGGKMINARGETAAEKASFKTPLLKPKPPARGRCLVPADSFIEWDQNARPKQPLRFHLPDYSTFALAGLYDTWYGAGEPLTTYTILTVAANADLAPYHERMPVVLLPDDEQAWLDPATPADDVVALLRQLPAGMLVADRISTRINSVRNDDDQCVELV